MSHFQTKSKTSSFSGKLNNLNNTKTVNNVFDENLLKYIFAYDCFKFQQILKVSEQAASSFRSNIYPQRFIKKKTRRMKYEGRNTQTKSRNIHSFPQSFYYNNLLDEFSFLKSNQEQTLEKLDYLIDSFSIKDGVNNKRVRKNISSISPLKLTRNDCFSYNNNYNQSIQSNNNTIGSTHQFFDYFSFKVKPDLSLPNSINKDKLPETLTLNEGLHHKSRSPDKLLSHRFFEDSNDFRNTNLMSVKTFINNNSTTNPFRTTTKSESDINKYKLSTINSVYDTTEKKEINLIKNKDSKLRNVTSESLKNNPSETMFLNDNNKEEDLLNDIKTDKSSLNLKREQTNSSMIQEDDKVTTTPKHSIMTENDNLSMNSSKIIDSSQEKFKKVRGFNFKNNIKTKKFTKPLINNTESSQANKDISQSITEYCHTNNDSKNSSVNNSQTSLPVVSRSGLKLGNIKIDENAHKHSSKDVHSHYKRHHRNQEQTGTPNFPSVNNETTSNDNKRFIKDSQVNISKSTNFVNEGEGSKGRIKMFNFNNNIKNTKTYLRQDSSSSNNYGSNVGGNSLQKEREKQYAIEIEEGEIKEEQLQNTGKDS
jgi:hypothetical protein